MMLRVLCVGLAIFGLVPANAATLQFETFETKLQTSFPHDLFQEAVDAYVLSYRAAPGPAPLPLKRMSFQLPLLMGAGLWIALALPRQKRRKKVALLNRLRGLG